MTSHIEYRIVWPTASPFYALGHNDAGLVGAQAALEHWRGVEHMKGGVIEARFVTESDWEAQYCGRGPCSNLSGHEGGCSL